MERSGAVQFLCSVEGLLEGAVMHVGQGHSAQSSFSPAKLSCMGTGADFSGELDLTGLKFHQKVQQSEKGARLCSEH